MALNRDVENLALIGWYLYPASAHSRAACIKSPTQQATCDLETLERWQTMFPGCSWRVVMGPSRIWGLDVDATPTHKHDGVRNLANLVKTRGVWPLHPIARTGGGGFFHVFSHTANEAIIGEAGHPVLGVDPRRGRQSQSVPPSIHVRTRKPYVWIVPPWAITPPPAPVWLLTLLRPPPPPEHPIPPVASPSTATAQLSRACDAVRNSAAGNHNNTLNRRAYQMGKAIAAGWISETEVFTALYAAARQVGQTNGEAIRTIRSGITAATRKP
jgi:hypothetical protein